MKKQHSYRVYPTNKAPYTLTTTGPAPLEVLQRAVGGYIESAVVEIDGKRYDAFVNEDGVRLGLSQNPDFPQYVGPVIVGKLKRSQFAGLSIDEVLL